MAKRCHHPLRIMTSNGSSWREPPPRVRSRVAASHHGLPVYARLTTAAICGTALEGRTIPGRPTATMTSVS